jgi:hypothetical protein
MYRRVCFFSALLAAVAGLAACSALISEPSCGRSRSVAGFDTLPDVAYQLTLTDQDPYKGAHAWDRVDYIDWSVTLHRSAVTAVHLHSRDDDRLLWDLTTPDDAYSPGYTAARSTEYSFQMDIAYLFSLVREGRTYIDVHTHGASEPVLRVDVTHLNFRDWETEHVCST